MLVNYKVFRVPRTSELVCLDFVVIGCGSLLLACFSKYCRLVDLLFLIKFCFCLLMLCYFCVT